MNVIFSGCEPTYDTELMCCLFFPGEKPFDGGDGVISVSLSENVWTIRIEMNGKIGEAAESFTPSGDSDLRKRIASTAFKKAFYRAARAVTDIAVPWGILSGIRPAKPIERLLSESDETAAFDFLTREYYTSPERARLGIAAARASLSADSELKKNAAGLYVGIPFCPSRCRYCSFVSHSIENAGALLPEYLGKLNAEIAEKGEIAKALGLEIAALYVGGGTPAVISADDTKRLFDSLDKAFSLSSVPEITFEAGRPDCITAEKAAAYAAVSHDMRVSVNPQSLVDPVLEKAGRRHTAADWYRALGDVRSAGLHDINADLIAGLEGDSLEGFSLSLDGLIAEKIPFITVHSLCLKRAADGMKAAPVAAAMVAASVKRLSAAGYSPYYLYRQRNTAGNLENIGWSVDRPCLYNIIMMEELRPVLACGAGSVSKLPSHGRIARLANCKYPYEYLSRPLRPKEDYTGVFSEGKQLL